MEERRREARRRNSETGADRLAFLTGRIHSLPENDSKAGSDPTVDRPLNKNAKNAWYVGAESLPSVPSSFQKSLSASSILKKSPPILPANKSPSVSSAFQNSSAVHDSSSSASHSEPFVQSQPACLQIFISDHLKACISVSENIRPFSSIFIALWVVLSYCGYLTGNGNVKSTPSLRLVYLV